MSLSNNLCFRPHIGDYFFIDIDTAEPMIHIEPRFRPHIGDYFFILSQT